MKTRRKWGTLWAFALLALLAHGALFVAVRSRDRATPREPTLAGKFVKRRPLRQQVLRRQAEAPQRRPSLRRSVAPPQAYARAMAPQVQRAATANMLYSPLSSMALRRSFTPGVGVSSVGRTRSQPVAVACKDRVDLGLELLDVDALDTGRYRALVVQEPGNPRGLKGFVHLTAVGIGSAIEAAENNQENLANLPALQRGDAKNTDWRYSANLLALDQLALELEAQTQLQATVDRDALLDEPDWLDTPFVLLTSPVDFEPTPREIENLGRYLVSGGFAYVEVVGTNSLVDLHYGKIADLESLRDLIVQSLTGQGLHRGTDWEIEPLALRHPLFSCYYEIRTMPRSYWSIVQAMTANAMEEYRTSPERFAWLGRAAPFLEGIYVRGRLAGIYSQQNYRDLWSRRLERAVAEPNGYELFYRQTLAGNRSTSDAALKLGLNTVVYALTREGSLARQMVSQ